MRAIPIGIFTFLILAQSLLFGFICRYLADKKNLSTNNFFCLGFFLGIIGLIVVIATPKKQQKQAVNSKKFDERVFAIILGAVALVTFFALPFVTFFGSHDVSAHFSTFFQATFFIDSLPANNLLWCLYENKFITGLILLLLTINLIMIVLIVTTKVVYHNKYKSEKIVKLEIILNILFLSLNLILLFGSLFMCVNSYITGVVYGDTFYFIHTFICLALWYFLKPRKIIVD